MQGWQACGPGILDQPSGPKRTPRDRAGWEVACHGGGSANSRVKEARMLRNQALPGEDTMQAASSEIKTRGVRDARDARCNM